ncbi:bifunctional protein-disulfide isomerase/oxidoreductase DsbC [Psychromonas sp. MME1]|uniref:bifunctional protein-disulfide isomerase/oxidoreductase DsbC n=1 Tax=Psychromonas sp. MME1 TaxID=3231032 RepID=UPI0034E21713
MLSSLFKKRIVSTMALVVFSSISFADPVVDKAIVDTIGTKMRSLQMQVNSVKPAVVEGLYEVTTNQGIFYVSKNGQYLLHGNIYDLDNKMENISEKSLIELRKAQLKAFEKDMIVYKAAEEKHVITVFTDTSCGYCQKLHAEMADYNKLGITVRYLAFPRGGVNSSAYNTMVSIWCADDPKAAMDSAKKRRNIDSKTCANTVKEQYDLGLSFGINGTPALILEDGSMQPGYVPADRLIQLLEQK